MTIGFLIGAILLIISIVATFIGRGVKRTNKQYETDVKAWDEAGRDRYNRPKEPGFTTGDATLFRFGGLAAFVLAVLAFGSSFIYIVPANNVAITTTFGKVNNQTLSSGLHIGNPFMKLNNWSTRLEESSMLLATDEGDKAKDDSTDVRASDNGVLYVDSTVLYRVDQAAAFKLFRDFKTLPNVKDKIVRPTGRSVIRDVFAGYTANDGLSTARQPIEAGITERLKSTLAPYGIIVDSVKIRGVRPSPQVEAAITQKIAAQQQAEQAKITQGQKLTEAETARQVAEKTAEAARLSAAGEADAVKIKADAEAYANKKVAESVTESLVEYIRAEALKEANTIYLPSNVTPIISVPSGK